MSRYVNGFRALHAKAERAVQRGGVNRRSVCPDCMRAFNSEELYRAHWRANHAPRRRA